MSTHRTADDLPILDHNLIAKAVANALSEDLGLAGDITATACLPATLSAQLSIRSRQTGVISGIGLAIEAFRQRDPNIQASVKKADGSVVAASDVVLEISGNARALLEAERTALNFMGRMCGVATLTSKFVDAISGTKASIVCTRKTTPGLRAFEKYAVRCGGGKNHRFGLFDAVLIKDNHIAIAGGIIPALRAAKSSLGHLVKIEIEVDTLDQLEDVLREGADVVLLDNMSPAQLREAVSRIKGKMLSEASGGVNLATVRAIAESGVDLISIGALTHSAPVLDLGLDYL